MAKLFNAGLLALSVFLATVLIFYYNPYGMYDVIKDNVDYFQFGVLLALFTATLYGLFPQGRRRR